MATDELRCGSLLINAALYLHFSFLAALIYLPVTNKPLGGNISPAAVQYPDWSYWIVPVHYSVTEPHIVTLVFFCFFFFY